MKPVRLDGFPVDLFAAFDEATEGLLREYMLIALAGGQPFTTTDIAGARQAKQVVTTAVGQSKGRISLQLRVTAAEAAAFPVLQAVLDHVNRLARDEKLLALPALPEIAAFRNWMCDQVVNQTDGAAPTGWELPVAMEEPGVAPASWSGMSSLPDDEAWLVGDDANRIVGASKAALALLGWQHLVGERIIAVIPHEFREQHIAAFTRGVNRDEHRLLGKPLPLAALASDGRTIPITLTLTRHAADADRAVYLAKLTRR
jgi:PAS domain-containing protein